MGFQQALSGLNATSRSLDVIGNNIANANTNGMKTSRAEFSELVASSFGYGGGSTGGLGVEVATVSQQFTQGNITVTGNDLDVAINGNGFYRLQMPDGSSAFSRAGQFKLDKGGFIVTNGGAKLLAYPTTVTGTQTSSTAVPIQLPTAAPIGAKQTGNLTAAFNVDARAVVASTATPPTPITTYGTSITAFDSQGVEVPVSLYFTKTAQDTWGVFQDPTAASPLFTMKFKIDGSLDTVTTPPIQTLTLKSPNTTIGNFTAKLDISKATQFGTQFAVSDLTQDGYAPGDLTGIKIAENGVISARYSNGQIQATGRVSLANFRNVQGLTPVGAGNWVETSSSGQPILGGPSEGKFGKLRSGALEDSNVDLTAELVNLITAQRAYQANAKTIETQDQTLQTLIAIR